MINLQSLTGGRIAFFSWLKCLFAFAVLLCVTSCSKDDISNLQSQADQPKAGEIATVDSQIKAIYTSIADLKKVDETVNGLIGELQKDGEKYAAQIADLQTMDSKLEEKIAALRRYTDGELAKQKDWVEATFATLEQLDSLCAVVTGVDATINSVTASLDSLKKEMAADYEESVKKAVSNLETSMKNWVNGQLADYYTIAQTDAAIKVLEEKYDMSDEDLKKEIDEQKTALENSKRDITEAYRKAIEEAISAHDGKINDKIATDIAAAKKELQDRIDAINTDIKNIKTRLDALEKELEELARRPQSIVVLAVEPIVLSTGAQATIEFRVNPPTAVFDYSEENCQILLDKVGTVQTKASYVTKPSNYKLVKIEPSIDEETKEVKAGQYCATIEDTGNSAEYDEVVALVLNIKDAKGNDIQISSSVFEIIGKNFENLPKYGLPILMINTPNATPIVSKDDYVEGSYVSLLNADMTYDYRGEMKIKGRGNSTWAEPKKPYKMKFDEKVPFFNWPKDKEWVLLANYIDKSMLKTAFTYQMAGTFGHFDYVPRFNFVDLILNDVYKGTYQLGDQIKIGKGRALNGEDGYLLETDSRAKAEADAVIFYSNKIAYPFNIKEMKVNGVKDVTASEDDSNYVYIRDFVLNAENVLYSDNWLDSENGYKKYLDMQSYVEWYLVNEIGRNNDACFFSSCYMTLKMGDGEKLHMGPLWDFDLAYGGTINSGNDQPEGFWIKKHGWWVRLFQDPAFVNAVKAQYNIYYAHKGDLLNSIDQYAATIEKSAIANNKLWGTLCANTSDDETTRHAFYAQVNDLKTWIATRMDWMKQEFDAM